MRQVLEPAFLSVYAQRVSLPSTARVVIATEVAEDGWGDVHAQLWVGKSVRAAFPEAQVRLVTLIEEPRRARLDRQIPPETWRGFERDVASPNDLHSELVERIRTADVVVEVATESEVLGRILELQRGTEATRERFPRYLHLSEYGVPGRPLASPRIGDSRSLGFGGTELGFMMRSGPVEPEARAPDLLLGLEDRELKRGVLLDDAQPGREISREDCEKFLARAELAFAYGGDPRALVAFICSQVKAFDGASKNDLVIVTNASALAQANDRPPAAESRIDGKRATEFLKSVFGTGDGRAFLASLGFRAVRMRWTQDGQVREAILALDSERAGPIARRTLTLHVFDTLSNDDVHRLMMASHFAIGCTGDASLSEVLSAGRLPYYGARQHKFGLARAITEIARTDSTAPALARFFERSELFLRETDWTHREPLESDFFERAGQLGVYLTDPSMRDAARDFSSTLVSERSAGLRVPAAVARAFAIHSHPELLEVEGAIFDRWTSGDAPSAQGLEPLREALDARGWSQPRTLP